MTQRDVLTTVAPPISADEAGAMMQQHFGLSGGARELSSERDRNFHITTPEGQGYVLKFTNPAEPQPGGPGGFVHKETEGAPSMTADPEIFVQVSSHVTDATRTCFPQPTYW